MLERLEISLTTLSRADQVDGLSSLNRWSLASTSRATNTHAMPTSKSFNVEKDAEKNRQAIGKIGSGIPQCAEVHAAGPFVAIGVYFSWRSLRMRSLRALMAANSR